MPWLDGPVPRSHRVLSLIGQAGPMDVCAIRVATGIPLGP
jgi:hypothetical protein